jgi:apolipoprotein N-acyltransferase
MLRFNSALYLDNQGRLLDSYDKMHPVLIGEYLPMGKLLPWLYALTPMGGGVEKGAAPKCFKIGGVKLAPHICFENTVPHLLRRQYRVLQAQGCEPDALVTITNDGWFWGSSLLDIHLAAAVFRAVELRRPLLIAANTGFSAWINCRGQILAQGPRRDTGALVAVVTRAKGASESVYLRWGDLPVGLCAIVCGLLPIAGWWGGRSTRSASAGSGES